MQPIHRRGRLLKQSPAIAGAEVAGDALADGDLLMYDAATGEWLTTKALVGNYSVQGTLTVLDSGGTDSLALSHNGTSAYLTATNTTNLVLTGQSGKLVVQSDVQIEGDRLYFASFTANGGTDALIGAQPGTTGKRLTFYDYQNTRAGLIWNLDANSWTMSGELTVGSGISTTGGLDDIGQVGPFAFMDWNVTHARFGAYDWDAAAWKSAYFVGLDVSLRNSAVSGYLTIGSSGAVTLVGTSVGITGDLVLSTSNNIYKSDATSGLTLSGGSSAGNGANIELYGGSHASLANRAYYDASVHAFRSQDGGTGYASFSSGGLDEYGYVAIRRTGSHLYMYDTDDAVDTADYSLIERNGNAVNFYFRDNSAATWYLGMKISDAGAVTLYYANTSKVVAGSGGLELPNATTGTTVGAAGAASALPANPTGYLTVTISGTARKIPYYAT